MYETTVTVAAEACAEDTKGHTCYICTQAAHWKTKEGLVRGCACRGTAGFAHVSCLAEQAKILVEEVEENNLDDMAMRARWNRWNSCSLCEQKYHGIVGCALGWACLKTYVGRPETDAAQRMAINLLGNGLSTSGYHQCALSVLEAELALQRRLGDSEGNILAVQSNLAGSYKANGRPECALRMQRDVYSGWLKLEGEESNDAIREAHNLAFVLLSLQRLEEAK
jgi:hypothetical protein